MTNFVKDNKRLQKLNKDYDITGKLQEEAEKLPEKLGDAAGTVRDVGIGLVNSIFAVVTILILTAFMLGRRAKMGRRGAALVTRGPGGVASSACSTARARRSATTWRGPCSRRPPPGSSPSSC